MLTGLEDSQNDAGHIRPIIRDGQSGFDEGIHEGDTPIVHDHETAVRSQQIL